MTNEDIILRQLSLYENFLESIGAVSSDDINKAIENNTIKDIISKAETRHKNLIEDCAKDILQRKSCRVILITGPSASGKTTFAKRLCETLANFSLNTLSISLDDYYKPLEDIPLGSDGKHDLEDIEAFEYLLLNEHIARLLNGESVSMPYYDFHNRVKIKEGKLISLKKNELLLIEGIQALNPKIADKIEEDKKYRIYCSALNSLKDDCGIRISSQTTRLLRRLVRDYYYRRADYKLTFDLWDKVEIGSEKNIYPYTKYADFIFNSATPYEYNLYIEHISKILASANSDGIYKEKINLVRDIASKFTKLDNGLIPEESIIREFIKM